MTIKCGICKNKIQENFRIDVFSRVRGSLKKIESYHRNCWNDLVRLWKETKPPTKQEGK